MTNRECNTEIGKNIPENEFLYISSKTPLINVDLLVINELGEILLSWRNDDYCGIGWHIPGGIIRHGETMKTRLEITAKRELGFIPEFELEPCKITEIFLRQEYRNHFISHLFKGTCRKSDVYVTGMNAEHNVGDLCWFDKYPGLVYSQIDYEQYLKQYFETMKK